MSKLKNKIYVHKDLGPLRVISFSKSDPDKMGFALVDINNILKEKSYTQQLKAIVSPRQQKKLQIKSLVHPAANSKRAWVVTEEGLLEILDYVTSDLAEPLMHWITDSILDRWADSADNGDAVPYYKSLPEKGARSVKNNKVCVVQAETKDSAPPAGWVEFNNPTFGKLRAFTKDGKPWFIGIDVARVLGYKDPRRAVSYHCPRRHKLIPGEVTGGNLQVCIPEGDMYRLVMGSKLPQAEKFTDWVVDEVLPSIRNHGAYITEDAITAILTRPGFWVSMLKGLLKDHAVKHLQGTTKENEGNTADLKRTIEELRIKLEDEKTYAAQMKSLVEVWVRQDAAWRRQANVH